MTDSQRWMTFGLLLLAGFLVYQLQPILMPFLVGAFFAYLGDPLADRLEASGLGRLAAVCTVFLVALVLIVLMLLVLLPMLGRQLDTLLETFPVVIAWVQENAIPWLQRYIDLPEGAQLTEKLKEALMKNWQSGGIPVGPGLCGVDCQSRIDSRCRLLPASRLGCVNGQDQGHVAPALATCHHQAGG
jgi:predicted PurR-regulated permease PerM